MLTPTKPSTHAYIRTVNRMGWSLVLFLVLFYLCTGISDTVSAILAAVARGYVSANVATALSGLIEAAAYMASFFLTGFFYRWITRRSPENLSVGQPRPVRYDLHLPAACPLYIIAALGINSAAAYLNAWMCALIGYMPSVTEPAVGYDQPATVILYMTVALAPAFAEEFLFRGVLYENLRPFGRTQAVLISALMFSLMHQNLSQVLYTFVCGILLALMYEWTGSIWCSVLFHLLNNQISVLSDVLYGNLESDLTFWLLTAWDILAIVLGASALIILVCHRRRTRRTDAEQGQGIFGRPTAVTERWDMPAGRAMAGRALRSPGMLLFMILSIANMALSYVLVVTENAGGVL